jgi:hypothetical protein
MIQCPGNDETPTFSKFPNRIATQRSPADSRGALKEPGQTRREVTTGNAYFVSI